MLSTRCFGLASPAMPPLRFSATGGMAGAKAGTRRQRLETGTVMYAGKIAEMRSVRGRFMPRGIPTPGHCSARSQARHEGAALYSAGSAARPFSWRVA